MIDNQPLTPPLDGIWTRLRPVTYPDFDFLYDLAIAEPLSFRWKFLTMPSREAFAERLNEDVLSAFVISERRSDVRLGVIQLHSANLNQGTAHLNIAMVPAVQRTGIGIEALGLLLKFAFSVWQLRKVVLTCPDYALRDIHSSIGALTTLEGTLTEHVYRDRKWWDLHLLAISRDQVEKIGRSLRDDGRIEIRVASREQSPNSG